MHLQIRGRQYTYNEFCEKTAYIYGLKESRMYVRLCSFSGIL